MGRGKCCEGGDQAVIEGTKVVIGDPPSPPRENPVSCEKLLLPLHFTDIKDSKRFFGLLLSCFSPAFYSRENYP